MSYYESSEEHGPVTYWRGHAIYAAHFVVLVFVASFIVCGLLMTFGQAGLLDWGVFDSASVLRGEVWRIFSYGLVNPPLRATVLWFAIDMLMLVWFGREVEKVFGRKKFFVLFGCLYLLCPLIFTAIGRWIPAPLAGEYGMAFAIFIAFATLYPNTAIFFMLLAKWVAGVLIAIYTVAAFAEHDWVSLIKLWADSAFAFAFVRHHQGVLQLPAFRFPRRQPKLRVLRSEEAARPTASASEIDALLDKIAQSGFGSLTAKERAKLEAARQELKKRSRS